jgi:hypothetical protein
VPLIATAGGRDAGALVYARASGINGVDGTSVSFVNYFAGSSTLYKISATAIWTVRSGSR